MESWQFIQSPSGDWYWLCSNVISRQTRESTATFKTRMECIANAMGCGYQKVAGGASPAQTQPRHHGKGSPPNAQHKGPQAGPRSGGAPQPTAKRAQRRNRNKSGKQSKAN
jgi:hypothetical protein